VTLRFLGDVPALSGDFEGLQQACAEVPPRVVNFGSALQRLGPAALVVPVTGTDDLAAMTRAAVAKADTVEDPTSYFGHMTVALPETPADVAWAQMMLGAPLNGRWVAEEVCVFASETVAGDKRYRVLARMPLSGHAVRGES
jgi:2'-5' RNA ligase